MNVSFRTLALAGLLAAPLSAQNLLANSDFENGLTGWTFFGNANAQTANPPSVVPRSGTQLASLFGNFAGGFNVTGIFQAFPAAAGESYTIDAWSRHYGGDPMIGTGAPNSNWCVMKIAFFDAASGGTEIGAAEGTILDGNSPTDTWIDNAPVTGVAPAGTQRVEAFILFLQPGNDGGAAQIDDMSFTKGQTQQAAYPGTGDDLTLATGLSAMTPTGGPGADVKTALPGEPLEIRVSTGGAYVFQPYSVFAQIFTTGMPPTPPVQFPGIQVQLSMPVLLVVDGFTGGPLGPPLLPPSGASTTVRVPTMPGSSALLQAIILTTNSGNGIYAASDAHEIQF